jgi:hypothetical protein
MSLQYLLQEALKEALSKSGLKGSANVTDKDLTITISKDEIVGRIIEALPPQLKPFTSVEASDIVIRIKLVM